MWNLCSGKTWANPSASSMDSAVATSRLAWRHPVRGIEDVRAHPEGLGRLPGDGQGIAGNHLHVHAHLDGGGNGRLGVLPWWIEQREHPTNFHGPSLRPGPRPRNGSPEPRTRRRSVDVRLNLRPVGRQPQDHWGAPFVTLNEDPSAPVTVASVHLRTASNGWKSTTW